MMCEDVAAIAISMTFGPAAALLSRMACLSDPGPESLTFVTVRTAACARRGAPKTTSAAISSVRHQNEYFISSPSGGYRTLFPIIAQFDYSQRRARLCG